MNNIYKLQNKPENQRLVVSQYFVYKKAKRLSLLLFAISTILPVGFNLLLIWIRNELIVTIFSFISICIIFLSEIIKYCIEKNKYNAALIQQKFDTIVFGFDNVFCFKEEIIDYYVEKYKNKDWNRKKDWYPDYGKKDKNTSVFYCQKENIDWTSNLSFKYIIFLVLCTILLALTITVNLIINNNTIGSIISLLIIGTPLLSYVCSGFFKIKKCNNSLKNILDYSNQVDYCIQKNGVVENKTVENLQWMIFSFRQEQFLIPDWFEKLFYKNISKLESKKAKKRRKSR